MSTDFETQGYWEQELATSASPSLDWIWHGYIAKGNLTLLTGLWKSGKTTLLSLLLTRRRPAACGLANDLASLAVHPGKTIVISEERRALWAARSRRYDFGGQVYFFPQPFRAVPSPEEWQRFIDRIAALHDEHRFDLLVIDPLAPILRGENNARNVLDVLMPLSALTERDMAVLAFHHPARGNPPAGQAARGSGALLAHVDIAIEMRHTGPETFSRRRRFFALSRHDETPRQLIVELNADGTDYVVVEEATQDGFDAAWPVLSMIFDDAPQKLTRQDVLNEWPADFDKPSPSSLRNHLEHAVENSLLACEGTGRKCDPFRYWFPKTEERWKQDFLYEVIEKQRQDLKLPFQSLTERKRILGQDAHLPSPPLEDELDEPEA